MCSSSHCSLVAAERNADQPAAEGRDDANRGGSSMHSMTTAAARALAGGAPLDRLTRIAARDEAPALVLRGIALAQLPDLPRAKVLLRRAARLNGTRSPYRG